LKIEGSGRNRFAALGVNIKLKSHSVALPYLGDIAMSEENPDLHLSRMNTLWSLVGQAHAGSPAEVQSAQEKMLDRYGNAIRRYLSASLRNSDHVDEVFQEFAHLFLRGGFRSVDPQRGRFRDYLKTTLYHLITAHGKKQKRQPAGLPENCPEPAADPPSVLDSDREFLTNWRKELLARSWAVLETVEQQTGRPLHTVLRFRADHPEVFSEKIASQLSAQLGQALTAPGVRQTLHRARAKFAAILVDEVLHALDQPTEAQLIEELIELNLLEYCKPALPTYQT
jgi:RNA polymerase sigma-70 factor (ECF subfamily)